MNETSTYHVSDAGSGHCSAAIVEEIARLKGVESVEVDLRSRLVRVTGRGLDTPTVVVAIYAAGYEAVVA
jgi:copper chaperone CopZ